MSSSKFTAGAARRTRTGRLVLSTTVDPTTDGRTRRQPRPAARRTSTRRQAVLAAVRAETWEA